MKKFLSLLLALTMVLSLTVVPARAASNEGEASPDVYAISSNIEIDSTLTTGGTTISGPIAKNTSVTFTIDTSSIKVQKNGSELGTSAYTLEYEWATGFSAQEANRNVAVYSVTGDTTATCTIKVKVGNDIKCSTTARSNKITVYDLDNAIEKVYFNDRPYAVTDTGATVFLGDKEDLAKGTWKVVPKAGYTVAATEGSTTNATYGNNKLTFNVGFDKVTPVEKEITIAQGTLSAPTVAITTPSNSSNKVRTNQEVVFTASGVTKSDNTQYSWTIQDTAEGAATAKASNPSSSNTYKWVPDKEGTYTVTCTLYEGTVKTNVSGSLNPNVTVEKDNTKIGRFFNPTMIPNSKQTLSFTFKDLDGKADKDVNLNTSDVAWSFTPVNTASSVAKLTQKDAKSAEFAIPANAAQNYTVKASFTYKNKPYEVVYNISTQPLTATLATSVQNGGSVTLYTNSVNSYSSLASLAQSAIYNQLKRTVTITSATLAKTASTRGTITNLYGTASNGYYTYAAPKAYIGNDELTITATDSNSNTYTIKLTIPVTPIATNFESVVAEPITSSSTYYNNTYRVTFPTTSFNQFYVVNKTGVAPTDYSSYNLVAGTTSTTLNASDFNATTGTCTLFVIAWNSNYNYNWSTGYAGKYYCGPITVSQTNYNINYNGVAGETVQFKHADFTNFMNEVSQARGDASKTGSYPYVTFNYVTFNYPTSTQGTLYYNGTAMSNSSYSGSFNSHTQITNLDNVTFVPYARTSAKSIPLTFTLSVTKYGANGAVVNRDLKYTGTVAVSIVREDIKYTAAPGDTIRFTDSDFLNYLRTQNGFNSNYYSIDYVTFDQSAVNALNEGVLYAYSTGFNAVKTTDKFYYTTTSYNQNALSDVTFRASAYAKTGTTVYIPFTIYARYGTTGTGTRQVSGTVAIKLAQTMNFVDVKPTDYFYDSVKWAVNSNITKGTSATTFSPYKTCTRAEIVTFLWRAAGSKTPTITRNPFTDVAPSMGMDYYYAILWASQNGIAAGTSATTFSPNATCTRAQIVTFLWRYSNKPAGYYSNPFTDVNKAEHAAYYDAILWAVGKGITKGTTATTFSPYGTCTRGEAVTFLYRAVNGK